MKTNLRKNENNLPCVSSTKESYLYYKEISDTEPMIDEQKVMDGVAKAL